MKTKQIDIKKEKRLKRKRQVDSGEKQSVLMRVITIFDIVIVLWTIIVFLVKNI